MQFGNIKPFITHFLLCLSVFRDFSFHACKTSSPQLFFILLVSMHNASVKESDLSGRMLLSCPWWALCFDPLTPHSHKLSLHSFLSMHISSSSSSIAAPHFSDHCFSIIFAQTQHIVCLCLAHHFRSLSFTRPACLPASLSFSYGPCLAASLNNVKLLCFAHKWKLSACNFSLILACLLNFPHCSFPLLSLSASLIVSPGTSGILLPEKPSALRPKRLSSFIQVIGTDFFQPDKHRHKTLLHYRTL